MPSYLDKRITVADALAMVQSNCQIVTGFGPCAAHAFLSELHTIADRVTDVVLTEGLLFREYPFFTDPAYRKSFLHDSWFYMACTRKAAWTGCQSYLPGHLHATVQKWLQTHTPDLYIGAASLPDEHGFVSLSTSCVYERSIIDKAKTVILEINPNYPVTMGDCQIPVSQVDYFIEADYPVPELIPVPVTEKDRVIGRYIAEFIHDGDCLQLGIGAIPDAVTQELYGKHDLGVHTELMTTGMMRLYQAGVVTGNCKQRERGRMVAGFAMGTRELYDFIDHNPAVVLMDISVANDPYVIAQNDNQVSINSTLEIDLTGQCASESIGSRQYSGTGGQTDTASGAQMSKNGRSFIALYATALIQNPATGERVEVSKIVPQLKPGAAVSLSRNDVDYVVTEYGVAALRGIPIRERVERLIAIAHPKFRDELRRQAYECGILYPRA